MNQTSNVIPAISARGSLPIRVKHRTAGVFVWDEEQQAYAGFHSLAPAWLVRAKWGTLYSEAPASQMDLAI